MGTLADLASSIATQFGIPPSIFTSLIGKESGAGAGSPDSTWNPNAVGTSGEIGLTQLLPSTAAALGVSDPLDVTQNLTGGAQYLSQLYGQFGNWQDALAAYNAGPGNVSSPQGQAYAASVLGAAGITGTGTGTQPAGGSTNSNVGGSGTSGSSTAHSVLIYTLAILVILMLLAFGVWGVVKG